MKDKVFLIVKWSPDKLTRQNFFFKCFYVLFSFFKELCTLYLLHVCTMHCMQVPLYTLPTPCIECMCNINQFTGYTYVAACPCCMYCPTTKLIQLPAPCIRQYYLFIAYSFSKTGQTVY